MAAPTHYCPIYSCTDLMFLHRRILLFALIIPIAFSGCGTPTSIAQVETREITLADLENAINELRQQNRNEPFPDHGTSAYEEIERRVLQRLINDEVIQLEADRMGITVSEDEVKKQLDELIAGSGSEAQFNLNLIEQRTTLDRISKNIRNSLMFERVYSHITKDVPETTDEQALDYYLQATGSDDPASLVPFDQARESIKADLYQKKKADTFQQWLEEVKRHKVIVIDEHYR